MATLTIGLFSSLVGSMNPDFAIKLIESAVNKGHTVNLWFSGNAVTLVRKGQKSFKDYSFSMERLKALQAKGVVIAVCEACAAARGIHKEDVLEGIAVHSMDWYVAKAAQSDRVLHIGKE
ncbi:DsrE family protein [bacterium]|nr:DsrE family protein [bacterium]MBU1598913.1 DsrE family protein [bacterium]